MTSWVLDLFRMCSEDPLADQQPHNVTPDVSATSTICMPE
jgi:hypothetical protein